MLRPLKSFVKSVTRKVKEKSFRTAVSNDKSSIKKITPNLANINSPTKPNLIQKTELTNEKEEAKFWAHYIKEREKEKSDTNREKYFKTVLGMSRPDADKKVQIENNKADNAGGSSLLDLAAAAAAGRAAAPAAGRIAAGAAALAAGGGVAGAAAAAAAGMIIAPHFLPESFPPSTDPIPRGGRLSQQKSNRSDGGVIPENIIAKAREMAQYGPEALGAFMASQGHPKNAQWCGDFAAAAVTAAGGTPPKNPALASNWRNFGEEVQTPQPGDIAVRNPGYSRRGSGETGDIGSHTTIVDSFDPKNPKTFGSIGGNQGRINSLQQTHKYRFFRSKVAAPPVLEVAPGPAPAPAAAPAAPAAPAAVLPGMMKLGGPATPPEQTVPAATTAPAAPAVQRTGPPAMSIPPPLPGPPDQPAPPDPNLVPPAAATPPARPPAEPAEPAVQRYTGSPGAMSIPPPLPRPANQPAPPDPNLVPPAAATPPAEAGRDGGAPPIGSPQYQGAKEAGAGNADLAPEPAEPAEPAVIPPAPVTPPVAAVAVAPASAPPAAGVRAAVASRKTETQHARPTRQFSGAGKGFPEEGYSGDSDILDRAANQVYSNNKRTAAGLRTRSVGLNPQDVNNTPVPNATPPKQDLDQLRSDADNNRNNPLTKINITDPPVSLAGLQSQAPVPDAAPAPIPVIPPSIEKLNNQAIQQKSKKESRSQEPNEQQSQNPSADNSNSSRSSSEQKDPFFHHTSSQNSWAPSLANYWKQI